MSSIIKYNKFKRLHILSGIALFVDDKLCLVLPKKFKKNKKYSIPKGHIESGIRPYMNALIELREETGIDIKKDYDDKIKYTYVKNGVKKKLTVFIIRLTKTEFDLTKVYKRNKKEIYDVVFVGKSKAKNLVENYFKKLINVLFKDIKIKV